MKNTAKEGQERVLKGEKLESTRSKTKTNTLKTSIAKKIVRKSTMQRTLSVSILLNSLVFFLNTRGN
jgi:hypothetical protein